MRSGNTKYLTRVYRPGNSSQITHLEHKKKHGSVTTGHGYGYREQRATTEIPALEIIYPKMCRIGNSLFIIHKYTQGKSHKQKSIHILFQ